MICLLNMALTIRYDVIIDPIFREIRPIESKFIVIYFISLICGSGQILIESISFEEFLNII